MLAASLNINNILLVLLLVYHLGDYYRKIEHTIYFPNNGSFTVGYHNFPMASLHFYPHTASVQYALTLIAFPVADITAAKTCTSIPTYCFKFLLGNSMLAIYDLDSLLFHVCYS